MKNIKQPIFVTGIQRSGSSIIARILSNCGVFTGAVTEMQENKDIRKVESAYFKQWFGISEKQQNIPNLNLITIPLTWEKTIKVCIESGVTENQHWLYKSARIAQIYPVWKYAFPDAKYIIVRRRTPDIIQSCMKTSFMNTYNTKEGWLGWVHEQERVFIDMIGSGLNCMEVWPERMVYGDFTQVLEMLEWLGLPWNDNIITLVTPLLKNSSLHKEK